MNINYEEKNIKSTNQAEHKSKEFSIIVSVAAAAAVAVAAAEVAAIAAELGKVLKLKGKYPLCYSSFYHVT